MVQLVDWDLAATTAATLGRSGPKVSYAEAAEVVAELRELTDVADEHVRNFTDLHARVSHPPVRVVDRPDWAAVNVRGLNTVFTPLVERLAEGREPSPIAQAVGSRIAGVQAGTILAYLSGKVLGQYEVFSTDAGQLLLVAPNIVEVERKLDAHPRDFRLWVCLHEVTHRAQFTAVPWMRDQFFAEVAAFVHASHLEPGQVAERLRAAVDAIARSVRDPRQSVNMLELVQTPAQREVLDRLTAMMTLLEGHAEYVMDGVGPEVVPSVDEIRAKFNQRREAASPIERVIRKLLGIDVKLRQYAEGRKFVHAVVDRVGMEDFNQVWTSAQTLPRKAELADPGAWIERVLGRSHPAGGGSGQSATTEPAAARTGTVTESVPSQVPPEKSTAGNTAARKSTAKAAPAGEASGKESAAEKPAGKTVAKKAVKKTTGGKTTGGKTTGGKTTGKRAAPSEPPSSTED